MVRRRQSTNKDPRALDDVPAQSAGTGELRETGAESSTHKQIYHHSSSAASSITGTRFASGSSTALSFPASSSALQDQLDERGIDANGADSDASRNIGAPTKSAISRYLDQGSPTAFQRSVHAARFAVDFNSMGFGSRISGTARPSKRSDSVDLAHAEGGAFLSAVDGVQSESVDLSSGSKRPRVSIMSVFIRALKGRKVFILLIACVLGALFLLGPSDRRKDVLLKANNAWESADEYIDKAGDFLQDIRKGSGDKPWSSAQRPSENVDTAPVPDNDPHKITIPPMQPGNTNNEASILDAVRKLPAVHSDKHKTSRCESNNGILDAHNQARPTVQYAIMIDAGSTGSRVHVYRFNFCTDSPELEDETFKMIKGGLSSFKENARGAAESLKPLLQVAMDTVPVEMRSCTPISVKATAGLRLLGIDLSKNILQAVRDMLQNEYPFPIADGSASNGVEIMEGRDEGVFAWITVNYLLNRIGNEKTPSTHDGSAASTDVQTAAVMDLGGASTQIVFEPIQTSNTQGMYPGEHVYELSNFGGKKYTLYQNSYLGYGLMEARKSINSLSYLSYSLAHPDHVRTGSMPNDAAAGAASSSTSKIRVPSPCFAEGQAKDVSVRVPGQEGTVDVTMFGTSGGYDACKRLVEVMMDKDAVCTKPPCSFGGVYQPSLMTAFAKSPIVALSYFYDRLTPLGLNGTFLVSELVSLTQKVCASPLQWPQHFGQKGSSDAANVALAELEDRPESCLDLTFLTTLLRLGYELDDSRSVTVAKKLAGNELGWCLGAQLQVLQDGVICRRG